MLNEILNTVVRQDALDQLVRWRQATTDGNEAYERCRYRAALRHYDLALTMATESFGHAPDAEAGMAAYVIAHHNLADTYERLGSTALQRLHLCLPHAKLCAAMNDATLPDTWQSAAHNHSRRTYTELVRFLGLHPEDSEARQVANHGAAGMTLGIPVQ
ncbi:hypothetical protein W822_04490 [Advenella kashmirensis W13003]|uniref:Tetratricopeptide repeat protein n=1 Tax=Advenella kashmirensis W13003 TaxID=1424334 RepID=V8QYL0_9BURK|nr:hypothetical protein [Advenella kashmirensis]ETF04415.1 hypothetical protein W822_04490 [Advenella kashmirensis W13003]